MRQIRTVFFLLVCLFAASVLSSCDSGEDVEWETGKKAMVETFLRRYPNVAYSDVTLDATDNSMTINDLHILLEDNWKDGGEDSVNACVGELSAEKLVARDVNFVDTPDGVIDLADTVTLSNVAFTLCNNRAKTVKDEETGERTTGTIEKLVIKKPHNDPLLFLLKTTALSDLLIDEEGIHTAGATAKNIVCKVYYEQDLVGDLSNSNLGKYMKSFDNLPKGESKVLEFTLAEAGFDKRLEEDGAVVFAKKYVQTIDGGTKLSAERLEASVKTSPDFFRGVMTQTPVEKLFEQDLDVDKIEIRDIKGYTSFGTIEAERFAFALVVDDEALKFKSSVEDVTIPLTLLDAVTDTLGYMKFSDLYDEPVLLSGTWDMDAILEEGTLLVDVSSFSLNEANLFNIQTSLSVSIDEATEPSDSEELFESDSWRLNKFKAVVEDKGLVGLIFTTAAAAQQGVTGEEAKEAGSVMRSQVAIFLPSMCAASMGKAYQGYCNSLGKAIASEGTFETLVHPPRPLDETGLIEAIKNPAKLGLKWKLTPAQ